MFPSLALTIALAADPAAPAADLMHVNYRIGALLGDSADATVTLSPLPMDPVMSRGLREGPALGGARAISVDRVLDLVRRVVAIDEWDAPGRALEVTAQQGERMLAVTAPAAVQAEVAGLLRFLASHVRREIRIRCDAYAIGVDGGDLASLVGARDAAERAKARATQGDFESVFGATVRCSAGTPAVASKAIDKSYLVDYDVEIAQSAAIHDPVVATVVLGTTLAARADVLGSGEVVLHFAIRHAYEAATARPVDASAQVQLSIESRTAFENRAPGFIEAPTIAFETLAGAARLEKGVPSVAFVAPLESGQYDDRGLLVVFTLESVGEAAATFASGPTTLSIADLGAFLEPNVQIAKVAPLAGSHRGFDEQAWDGLISSIVIPISGSPVLPHPEIETLLGQAAALFGGDGPEIEIDSGFAFIVARADGADHATRLAGHFSAPISRSTMIGVAVSASEKAQRRATIAMPLAGRRFLAIDGVEENLLVEANVDVANGAACANPVVMTILSGRCTEASLSAEPDADHVAISGFGRSRTSPIHHLQYRSDCAPQLERASFASSRFSATLRFAGGNAPERIDAVAPDGETGTFDLELRVVGR